MKAFATLLALLFPLMAQATVDLGIPATETPYDAYLQPVCRVLEHCQKQPPTMQRAYDLMNTAWSFRYVFEEPYRPQSPATTARLQSGDCKDKALWLCQQLGDGSIHFVVGKLHLNSAMSHAWLLWQKEGHWWILDPTNSELPIDAEATSPEMYLPLYSYTKHGKFIHALAVARGAGQGAAVPQVASTR